MVAEQEVIKNNSYTAGLPREPDRTCSGRQGHRLRVEDHPGRRTTRPASTAAARLPIQRSCTFALAAALAAPGLAVGSFLNVVCIPAAAAPAAFETALSAACSCGTEIKPYDNLPLVPYSAILRGRCRSCGERIPVRYPIVEATTAALVVACGLRFGLTADAPSLRSSARCSSSSRRSTSSAGSSRTGSCCPRQALCWSHRRCCTRASSGFWPRSSPPSSSLLLALVDPAGMGMGDIKLALLLGAMLGRDVGVALMIGLLSAFVPAVFVSPRAARPRGRSRSRSGRSWPSEAWSPSSPASRCSTGTSAS